MAGLFMAASPAQATITGNIDATITLTAACKINDTLTPDGTTGVDFGDINFGSQNTYFVTADAQLVGSLGNGIKLQCSNGITPVISFAGGNNAGTGTSNTGTTGARSMKHVSATNYVTYNLYSDSSGGTIIPVNGTISLLSDGSVQTVPVFGRAFGANGLITGDYSDVVVVTITL
jgi:spore coat protein U-like protein